MQHLDFLAVTQSTRGVCDQDGFEFTLHFGVWDSGLELWGCGGGDGTVGLGPFHGEDETRRPGKPPYLRMRGVSDVSAAAQVSQRAHLDGSCGKLADMRHRMEGIPRVIHRAVERDAALHRLRSGGNPA